jgi:putative phosphoesterase
MKIGILSDTHNEQAATQRALQAFRQRGIQTLFHCGDLVFAEMVRLFNEFEVYFVSGNMDSNYRQGIKMEIEKWPGMHWLGKGDEVQLDGKRLAITHGARFEVLEMMLWAEPDYLFHGHTHRRRDERVGPTRIINPGALGGTQHEARSVCVLDLEMDHLQVVRF